jgi:orotate phosphoribosyltransferase
VGNVSRILLLDDVITNGSTITCAVRRLHDVNAELDVAVASAGQMIVKAAVREEAGFLADTDA